MTETDLVKQFRSTCESLLYGCDTWKICDRMTGGLPDLEVNWNGFTSKIEFKYLRRDEENIHDKWEDGRQLVTCVKYERTTQRCWVVAFMAPSVKYRRTVEHTIIYRPSALLGEKQPRDPQCRASFTTRELPELWTQGVIRLEGYNHTGLTNLIRLTHS